MARTKRTSRSRLPGSRLPHRKGRSRITSRFLELGIVASFSLALVYTVSFAVKAARPVSRERQVPQISLRMQVLNGCGEKGCAGLVAERLERLVRFPLEVSIVDVDNFTVFDVEKSFFISRVPELNEARTLADQIGLSAADIVFAPLEDNYRSIHVTLVVGKDYKARFLREL